MSTSSAFAIMPRRFIRALGLALMLGWQLVVASVHADASARSPCQPGLVRAYRELLAIELGARAEQAAALTLDCDAASARVWTARGERVVERSVALAAPDAARWLALAARELLQTEPYASDRGGTTLTQPPAYPAPGRDRSLMLYAAARARLGDWPSTIRAGVEVGGIAMLRPWLSLELAARFTAGARAGLGPVRIRAFDAGGALFIHYAYERGRLQVLIGPGWTVGYTVLQPRSRDPALRLHKVQAAFTGPTLGLRLLVSVLPRLRVLGGFEAAYLWPRIDGRHESGDTLFRQRTWSVSCTLGLSFLL